ncbi:C2 domain-containing protein At1g53590-like [Rutidosis leptorrhynchoides]|uniref:C2 domain-containing protein At1g53590-like n=1 Tax=Rutidosis leptorrhynchoides TaxID=125765 RepID=UPI003A9A1E4F
MEITIVHHIGIVLLVIWLLSSFNSCHLLVYVISFIYLYMVQEKFATKFRRKVRFEERRQTDRERVLCESESVQWLNHLIEKIWPICLEDIISQHLILPIIPWILRKYKPWAVKDLSIEKLYLGRSPPMITEMRIFHQSTSDDHLVLKVGLSFHTVDDMSAILAAKLTKKVCFGLLAKLHLTELHLEGKVLVGIKFLPKWPFLGHLRVCFDEPHCFELTVKSIFARGHDVTELPRLVGWLDELLKVIFKETVVEPNTLVVDVEKLVSTLPETRLSVDAKELVGHALVEVLEGSNLKPSDINGLLDPYVKGRFGAYRFRTKTQKKTASPKWYEKFRIPITTWDSPNLLEIVLGDKHLDILGDCCVKINDYRDGKRHDIWLPLENIKMGSLHLVIEVIEVQVKGLVDPQCNVNTQESKINQEDTPHNFPANSTIMATDTFESVRVEALRETCIRVHRVGPGVADASEPKKGKNKVQKEAIKLKKNKNKVHKDAEATSSVITNELSYSDENKEGKKKTKNMFKERFNRMSSVFHGSPRREKDKDKTRHGKKQVCEDYDSFPHHDLEFIANHVITSTPSRK